MDLAFPDRRHVLLVLALDVSVARYVHLSVEHRSRCRRETFVHADNGANAASLACGSYGLDMIPGDFYRIFKQLLVKAARQRIVRQRFVPVRKERQESLRETDKLRAMPCRLLNQVAGDLGRTVKINERRLRLNRSQSNFSENEATVGFQSHMLPIGFHVMIMLAV
jgi:hypothetical protein